MKLYRSNRIRGGRVLAWQDTNGEYHAPDLIDKREVLSEARRLGARNVSDISFSEAKRLLSEGFECICYSKDRYGNTSACVCGKNVATTGLPRDDEEYIYTDKPNAASAILSNR